MQNARLEVHRLGWPVSNIWLLPHTSIGPVLVDAGFAALWPALVAGLRRLGAPPERLGAVILTHRHSDHAGNAGRLQRRHGVPVYAHRDDADVLMGLAPAPRLETTASMAGGMCAIENRFPARVRDVKPLADGDEVAGLEVHWTPGHTRGSVMLFHRASGTLFSGDCLINAVPPLTVETALSLPYPDFCDDFPSALSSLDGVLARDLEVRRLCCGHGPVRRGPVAEQARALLAKTRGP